MVWGKSKKAAEGEPARSPGDRKAPDAGLTSCYDFIQYLGSGGSGKHSAYTQGSAVKKGYEDLCASRKSS